MIINSKKGQGTIEYLVIIAIVIVIALVVVGLLLQVMDQGSGVPEQTAKIAWQSATPWAIVDWSQTATTMTVVLKNNSYETLSFTKMQIANTDFNSTTRNVPAGGTYTITGTGGISNPGSGQRYSYEKDEISISYDTSNITGRVQRGAADIVGTVN